MLKNFREWCTSHRVLTLSLANSMALFLFICLVVVTGASDTPTAQAEAAQAEAAQAEAASDNTASTPPRKRAESPPTEDERKPPKKG